MSPRAKQSARDWIRKAAREWVAPIVVTVVTAGIVAFAAYFPMDAAARATTNAKLEEHDKAIAENKADTADMSKDLTRVREDVAWMRGWMERRDR